MTSLEWKFRLKASCQKWHNLHVMPIEGDFNSRYESTWYCFFKNFKAVSRLFLLDFVSNFSWPAHLYLFQTSIICLVYFSYFDPLFCVQDNLKMAQSNILKIKTHMYRHMHKTQQIFRPWPWLMTSSRRHFVKFSDNKLLIISS